MKIMPGDFNAKLGRKDICKTTIENESLPQESTDDGARIVNFATSKNVVVKSTMFQIRNSNTYTCISPGGKTHLEFSWEDMQIDHILIEGIQVQ
jgi:hypothetical protein